MNRILVIRGGAIGDFILTLPALKALRDSHPQAHIEILGYKHIAAIAEHRFYADAVRSIEYGPLSSLFAKNLPPKTEIADYFASFDLVISYLYDPDRIFATNLRKCGVENLIEGPSKIGPSAHACQQLARPIQELGISVADLRPRVFPSLEDRQFAEKFLHGLAPPFLALHPGSGSKRKNWPLQNWIDLGNELSKRVSVIVVSGEADQTQVEELKRVYDRDRLRFAENLRLPHLAAILEQTVFIGHDSGISHLAAAVGAPSLLLFGPTDPRIWAPLK